MDICLNDFYSLVVIIHEVAFLSYVVHYFGDL